MENRPTIPNRTGFADLMRPGERIAALVYLPIHVFALPLLLPYLVYAVPDITAVDINLTYYVIGFVYVLALCWRFLRAGFDAALDRLGTFVLAILTAYLLEMALSMVISSLIVALNLGLGSSPNNDAFVSMIPEGRSRIIAMTVFMAPIVEEVLFRGLVFGALQRRSRALAWVVSVLAFSLYHVWQYVVEAQSAAMLLYALLYIPSSMSFNWCYERSGSIWAPIVYHMLSNAISMSLLA